MPGRIGRMALIAIAMLVSLPTAQARTLSEIEQTGSLRLCLAGSSAEFYRANGEALARYLGVTAETLALYVRFWLSITPPVPPDAHAAAQAKGRERFDGFVETLGKRLQKGQSFLREIPDDVPAASPNEEPR